MPERSERVFRSPTNGVVIVLWALFIVVGVVVAVTAENAFAHVLGVLFAVAAAILAIRTARSGVYVDEDGVVARADRFTSRFT